MNSAIQLKSIFAKAFLTKHDECFQKITYISPRRHIVAINLTKSNKRLIEARRGEEERLPLSSIGEPSAVAIPLLVS